MVHAGGVFVAGIHPSMTRTSESLESVRSVYTLNRKRCFFFVCLFCFVLFVCLFGGFFGGGGGGGGGEGVMESEPEAQRAQHNID